MSRTTPRNPDAWEALAGPDRDAVLAAALATVAPDNASRLISRGKSALLLGACALVDKRDRARAAFEALEHDEAESELLEAWERGGVRRALLMAAALRYGWDLPPTSRDLLLAELDIIEAGDEMIEDLAMALERLALVAPVWALAGAPICSEALIEALDRCDAGVHERIVDGYAELLARKSLETLPEPADVHGILVHDLLASGHGERLLTTLAARLGMGMAASAARLLRATMAVAVDPHATEGYVVRRATGQGELADESMMRGIFEHLQIEYDDVGTEAWSLVLAREDELGEVTRSRLLASLTDEHVVLSWPEPMPTPTEEAWWPDLLHRHRNLGLARFELDDEGRLAIKVVQRREGFEMAHFNAGLEALLAAFEELHS